MAEIKKKRIGFWSLFGAVLSAAGLIEFFAWAFSGHYIADYLGGESSPVVIAIADHIAGMDTVAFYGVVAGVVAVLSLVIALTIVHALGLYKEAGA